VTANTTTATATPSIIICYNLGRIGWVVTVHWAIRINIWLPRLSK
jgi:hypothetical protein